MGLDAVTTWEQAWRDAYGTPAAWQREHDGEREPVYAAGDVFAQELADTAEGPRAKWREDKRRARERRDLSIRELTDARDAARLERERRP